MYEGLKQTDFEIQLQSVPKHLGMRGILFDARRLFQELAISQTSTPDLVRENGQTSIERYLSYLNQELKSRERPVNLAYLGATDNIELLVRDLNTKGRSIHNCHHILTSCVNPNATGIRCFLQTNHQGLITLAYTLVGYNGDDVRQYQLNSLLGK